AAASFGVTLVLFSLSRTLWLSTLLLLPVGGSMMVQMAASNTLIQSMVPDALRGRVMAVYSMMFMGMAPFGALWAGAVAERIGAPATVVIGGVVCLVAAAVFGLRLPALRGEARELIIAQGLAGGVPPAAVTGQPTVD
ncbi:MAG TPA: MFS transporter, partial [Vicinamibacterales bacterium]|nr:MFS transporter [Vicinamibacterales bacterium]